MSAFVDNLNLRPQEKRLIVIIGIVVFVLLNVILVFPHFKDKGNIERQLAQTRSDILKYETKISEDTNPKNGYLKQLENLKQQGSGVDSQYGGDIKLQTTVTAQAISSGVNIQNYDPVKSLQLGTNEGSQFFEKQSMSITAMAKEESLVNFLYNVGNDPAMIRVWELDLRPGDANRYLLKTRIVLTADYKKSSKTKALGAKAGGPLKPTATLPHPGPQLPGAGPGSARGNGPGQTGATKSAAFGKKQ